MDIPGIKDLADAEALGVSCGGPMDSATGTIYALDAALGAALDVPEPGTLALLAWALAAVPFAAARAGRGA